MGSWFFPPLSLYLMEYKLSLEKVWIYESNKYDEYVVKLKNGLVILHAVTCQKSMALKIFPTAFFAETAPSKN